MVAEFFYFLSMFFFFSPFHLWNMGNGSALNIVLEV